MEPSEFDKLIQSCLKEKTSLHEHEMETAKPFVWGAILNNQNSGNFLRWYHLVAAVILLMIGFSVVLYQTNIRHEKEIIQLTSRMDHAIQQFEIQASLLSDKNEQLQVLEMKLKNVETTLSNNEQVNPIKENYRIIHRTDTVYVRQVEYVTKIESLTEQQESVSEFKTASETGGDTKVKNVSTSDIPIFLTQVKKEKNSSGETVQVKFGSFVKGQ